MSSPECGTQASESLPQQPASAFPHQSRVDLKQRTMSGLRWLALSGVIQRLAGFATTVVLARLLDPADFGLYALAFVVIDGFGLFQNLGVDAALIQRKDDDPLATDTAFWMIPCMGLLLFAGTQLLAPGLAGWLGNPQVASVIHWLGIIFLISAVGRVPLALLSKRTEFARRSQAQMTGEVVYAVIAVSLALCGLKVWSLVIGYLMKVLTINTLAWWFARWRPTFQFRHQIAKQMLHFGGFLAASGVLWFIKDTVGNLLVGKLLGVTALGFYTIAFGLSNFMNAYVFGRLYDISFPVLARLQHDRCDLGRAYLKFLKYVSIIAVPVGIGLATVAPSFLRVVYGEKWLPAAPVLQVLAIGMMAGALCYPGFAVLSASGHAKWTFLVCLLSVISYLGCLVPFAHQWGTIGASLAVSTSNTLTAIASILAVRYAINVPWRGFLQTLRVPMLGGAVLLFAVVVGGALLPLAGAWSVSPLRGLLLIAIVGGLTYLGYLTITERAFLADVSSLFKLRTSFYGGER